MWRTGNVLFRAPEFPSSSTHKMEKWARAADSQGHDYIIWVSNRPRADRLVIQRLDSYYCFEVSQADS